MLQDQLHDGELVGAARRVQHVAAVVVEAVELGAALDQLLADGEQAAAHRQVQGRLALQVLRVQVGARVDERLDHVRVIQRLEVGQVLRFLRVLELGAAHDEDHERRDAEGAASQIDRVLATVQ